MIPHAEDRIAEWIAARAGAGRMLLALDFDGTLAPLVAQPDAAAILPAARTAVAALADRSDTLVAIVSGRGLSDVCSRVGLDRLYYAGNHGLEIEGPSVRRVHEQAEQARPALAECAHRLAPLEREYGGVQVEDKGLSLSVHYRRVEDASAARDIVGRVHALCGGVPGVRLTEGKKVVEIRPEVDWDKGRATLFLIETLLREARTAPVVFIGDDRTDEDAFRAIGDRGDGVIVADPPPSDTAARSYLRSPADVAAFLERLARA
jgi:trehalose-phosphatase